MASPLDSEPLACNSVVLVFSLFHNDLSLYEEDNKVEETRVPNDHSAVNSAVNTSSVSTAGGTVAGCSQASMCP